MRPTTLLGLAFVGIFGFLVVTSFGEQVSGWETFEDATASGQTAHVVGTWDRDAPAVYDPARNVFSFVMTDTAGVTRPVVYANTKPANFEDAERVVVRGQMAASGEVFEAEHILVKCPSKYNEMQDLEGGHPDDIPREGYPAPAADVPVTSSSSRR